MPQPLRHVLSDLNTETRKAICCICGPVNIRLVKNKNISRYYCDKARTLSRKNWKQAHPTNKRAHKLKTLYGLTLDQYFCMVENQNDKCAICGKEDDRSLSVDHCHESGKVRQLLCNRCNSGLGQFKDDPDTILRAYEYLRKHKPPTT